MLVKVLSFWMSRKRMDGDLHALSCRRVESKPVHCMIASLPHQNRFLRSHHQATITNQCSSFFNGTFCDASTFRYASTFRDTSTFGDAYEDCLLEMVTRRSTRVILSTRQAVLLHRRKENECISSEAIVTTLPHFSTMDL